MTSLLQILMLILDVVWFIMIAHIVMSWLINFQVLNLRQPIVAQIWYGLEPPAGAALRPDPADPARHRRARPGAAGRADRRSTRCASSC